VGRDRREKGEKKNRASWVWGIGGGYVEGKEGRAGRGDVVKIKNGARVVKGRQ